MDVRGIAGGHGVRARCRLARGTRLRLRRFRRRRGGGGGGGGDIGGCGRGHHHGGSNAARRRRGRRVHGAALLVSCSGSHRCMGGLRRELDRLRGVLLGSSGAVVKQGQSMEGCACPDAKARPFPATGARPTCKGAVVRGCPRVMCQLRTGWLGRSPRSSPSSCAILFFLLSTNFVYRESSASILSSRFHWLSLTTISSLKFCARCLGRDDNVASGWFCWEATKTQKKLLSANIS